MYEPDYTDSLRADILPSYSDSLMHHGIKGMHWGVRRYQNPDGSYTSAGKARRGMSDKTKKNLKRSAIGVAALGAAGLAGYGLYKVHSSKISNNNKDSLDDAIIIDKHGNKVDENDPKVQAAIEEAIRRQREMEDFLQKEEKKRQSKKSDFDRLLGTQEAYHNIVARKIPLGLPAKFETSYDGSPVTKARSHAAKLKAHRDVALEDYIHNQDMLDRNLNSYIPDEEYYKIRPYYVESIPRTRKKVIDTNQEYVDYVREHPYAR